MFKAIWMLAGFCLAWSAHAASFDCAKATSQVERFICGSTELSQLDDELTRAYRAALANPGREVALRQAQRQWLQERNRCTYPLCVKNAYEARLHALRQETPPSLSQAKGNDPLREVFSTLEYRPSDFQIVQRGDHVIFSQYDQSGNNFDVVSLGVADLSRDYVVRGRYGAQFIAQNDKYLVISEKGQMANPLVVIDRATGERLKQIRLQQGISWARIEGNRLIAIQGAWLGGGYTSKANALILELPSLRVVKSVEIMGGNDAAVWNGQILSLGYNLYFYDFDLNLITDVVFPKRKDGKGVSCAATSHLRLYKDKATVVSDCGDIWVIDLATRRIERTIPSYAHFYAVAIMDGLIFTAPTSEPRLKNQARVFDLQSGKELAVLPINATDLFAVGNRLLAVERESAKPSLMKLYEVDVPALRSGQWRVEKVLQACSAADRLDAENDLYGAIAMCREAGIEGMLAEASSLPEVRAALRRQALRLARSLDGARNAIPLLEALQEVAADGEQQAALTEARLMARVLEGEVVGALTPQELSTPFGKVLELAPRSQKGQSKNIDIGAFSNLFHFSGKRLYVGRYGNNGPYGGDANVGVLDRATLDEVASVLIARDDRDYQDSVVSLAADERYAYVGVQYRYEDEGAKERRPNLYVIDRKTERLVRSLYMAASPSLHWREGELLACACPGYSGSGCYAVDPASGKTSSRPRLICVAQPIGQDAAVVEMPESLDSPAQVVVATRDYVVTRKLYDRRAPYQVYPRSGPGKPVPLTQEDLGPEAMDRVMLVSGNSLLMGERLRHGIAIKRIDLPAGKLHTLIAVPTSRSRHVVPLAHGQTLLLGLGRDLLLFDMRNGRLLRYLKDFIAVDFRDNGHGLDRHRIDRLIVDSGRLIAIAFYGANSRVVPLSELPLAD